MTRDAAAMAPELSLFLGGLATLVGGSFTPRTRQWRIRALAALATVVCAAFAVASSAGDPRSVFEGAYAVDDVTGVARILVAAGLLAVLALSGSEIAAHPRESEICTMLLLGGTGVLLMAGTQDLALLVVAFLLSSIPLYGLIGVLVDRAAPSPTAGSEAALKTYLLAALFGTVLMLGVAVLYGVSGGTAYADLHAAAAGGHAVGGTPAAAVVGGLVLVLGGLLFKAGAVPGHFWVPDASQGASATAAAYLTTVPKIGGVLAIARLLEALPAQDRWRLMIGVIAAVTMTLGNLAAYPQTDPRRLLGWSTVSQVGYVLVPVAVLHDSDLAMPALLLYLAAYTVTNIGAFAVTAALPERRDLEDWSGLIRSRPVLAVGLVVLLLGLVGTPPTGIFVGKLGAAAAAWDGSTAWLAVVLLVNTVASLFYYLRWIAPVVSTGRGPSDEPAPSAGRWASATVTATALLSLLIGLGAGLLWHGFDVDFLS